MLITEHDKKFGCPRYFGAPTSVAPHFIARAKAATIGFAQ